MYVIALFLHGALPSRRNDTVTESGVFFVPLEPRLTYFKAAYRFIQHSARTHTLHPRGKRNIYIRLNNPMKVYCPEKHYLRKKGSITERVGTRTVEAAIDSFPSGRPPPCSCLDARPLLYDPSPTAAHLPE